MLLGYNTNGFAHHAPADAIALLAEIGYQSVAITIDHGWLNPAAADFHGNLESMRQLLARHGMRSVIETGARYLLDPRQKHEPTLVSADPAGRARRVEFLKQAIDIAAELESDCVSFWSGVVRDPAEPEQVWKRLTDGVRELVYYAADKHVVLGFEPEPGMWIDTQQRLAELLSRLDAPRVHLTLDIGHLHCQGELPIADHIRQWEDLIVNVHLEDMRAGVHEHLMFGEGEIDFPPVLAALAEFGYAGGVHVELSRHSHMAPEAARRSYEFLRPLVKSY